MATVKPQKGMRSKVAELLSLGLSRAEITERLRISVGSYSNHLQAIRRDLGWQAQ